MADHKGYRRDFRYHGHVAGYQSPTLIVATDGATADQQVGMGYLATNGQFGCVGQPHPRGLMGNSPSLVAELRAIYLALRRLPDDQPVTILSHSESVAQYLVMWQAGSIRLPPGYGNYRSSHHKPTLQKLVELLASRPEQYQYASVDRNSSALNEAASSLARLGLGVQQGNRSVDTAKTTALDWASQCLRGMGDAGRA
ncbi:MAG TPA: hypothetical protein VLI05_03935 [Candidatus Saccharimonadia bacterium]|nr:hypothetical protein [Candidatus Saccharimonadia bacterium]